MTDRGKKQTITALSIHLAKADIKHHMEAKGVRPSSIMPKELSLKAKAIASDYEPLALAALQWCDRNYQP